MTEPHRLFAITAVMMTDSSRSDLLSMACVLHRRGAEVIAAELSPVLNGRRLFTATFGATTQQAFTVRRSVENLINVIDVSLGDAQDAQVTQRGRQQYSSGVARRESHTGSIGVAAE
jgi:hypothetical protein